MNEKSHESVFLEIQVQEEIFLVSEKCALPLVPHGDELHYYQNGGHGFGSYKRGATADRWFDQFMAWMETRGLLAKADTQNAD